MFFGAEVQPGKPATPESELGEILHISQACLANPKDFSPTYLQIQVGKKSYSVCCLQRDSTPHASLDLFVTTKSDVKLSVKGTNDIHVLGYFEPQAHEEEDEMSEGESELAMDDVEGLKSQIEDESDEEEGDNEVEGSEPDGEHKLDIKKKSKPMAAKAAAKDEDEEDEDEDEGEDEEDESDAKLLNGNSDEEIEGGDEDEDEEDEDEDEDEEDEDEEALALQKREEAAAAAQKQKEAQLKRKKDKNETDVQSSQPSKKQKAVTGAKVVNTGKTTTVKPKSAPAEALGKQINGSTNKKAPVAENSDDKKKKSEKPAEKSEKSTEKSEKSTEKSEKSTEKTEKSAEKSEKSTDSAGEAGYEKEIQKFLKTHGRTPLGQLGSKVKKPNSVTIKLTQFLRERPTVFEIQSGMVSLVKA